MLVPSLRHHVSELNYVLTNNPNFKPHNSTYHLGLISKLGYMVFQNDKILLNGASHYNRTQESTVSAIEVSYCSSTYSLGILRQQNSRRRERKFWLATEIRFLTISFSDKSSNKCIFSFIKTYIHLHHRSLHFS